MSRIHGLSLLAMLLALAGCASMSAEPPGARALGWTIPHGRGTATTYAEFETDGRPKAIGVAWSAHAFDGLPQGSDMHHCHGVGADGPVGSQAKCVPTFEHVLPLPDAVARRPDVPFKWVLLNWNPAGHIPPGVYDVPHFDVHFMIAPIADVFAIETGTCGPEGVRCDQFAIGKRPLPGNYVPADFRDVDAVVPAMGNHLIDLTGPEFRKQPFTHSFIYGAYDGKVIFYEQMVARGYLLGKPDGCTPIKSPQAVALGGYYPTLTCQRYDARTGEYMASLERFVRREASAPEPIPAAK
ncbi:MAG: hypothetical protein ACM3JC_15560 [Rudaea sp.]